MRAKLTHALAAAAVLAVAASAQTGLGVQQVQRPEVAGYAQAVQMLKIEHVVPPVFESDTMPAGTQFGVVPKGPGCSHWPAEGAGSRFSITQGKDGFSQIYKGLEIVRVFAGGTGKTGPHDNLIKIMAPPCGCMNGFVDVYIKSLVDSVDYVAYARVEVAGYPTVMHVFHGSSGGLWQETRKTFPVFVGASGLDIHAKSMIDVDNLAQPTYQGLVHLEVNVRFRLPFAEYTTHGVGCPGTNGVPTLGPAPGELPVMGEMFDLAVMNLPLDPAKGAYGFFADQQLVPPIDLGLVGMPGCYLHVYPTVTFPLAKVGGLATWSMFIPVDQSLVGANFYQQVFALDASSVNALGAVVSDYGRGTIGIEPLPPLQ